MVLLVYVCALYTVIIASCAALLTGIQPGFCPSIDSHCVFPNMIHGKGDEQIYPLDKITIEDVGGGIEFKNGTEFPLNNNGSRQLNTPLTT